MMRFQLTVLFAILASAAVSAQHGHTRAEVENGARLFQASCATCHGPKGDAVRGVALLSGQYKSATSDEQLVKIIIEGIPGTSMPPNNYSALEAGMIVAYLRGIAAGDNVTVTAGDLARGKALFEGRGKCATCHTPESRTAPRLRRSACFGARSSSNRLFSIRVRNCILTIDTFEPSRSPAPS